VNKLKVFFAVLLTVATLTHIKPAKAAVGAFVGGPVVVAGLYIMGGAVVGTIGGLVACEVTNDNGDMAGACGVIPMILGTLAAGVGLLVLDGEQDYQFQELSPAHAKKIGVTPEELVVYNSEIDQANILMAEVKIELSKIEKPTAQDSVVAWSAVKDLVSSETFATMQKIASQK
jgi:hypothetical protein